MYKRLLYNDNCILNTTKNTVIFDFNTEWNIYLDWKLNNKEEDVRDEIEKKNILLWNGGNPHIENDIESFYYKSGCLIKRIEKNKTIYFSNSKIYKEEISKDNKIISEKNYSENEILYKEVDYIQKTFKEYEIDTGFINCYKKTRGEFTYETYYKDSILYKCVLIKNNIILRVKEMYPSSKQIKSKLKRDFDVWEFTEYWISGILRSSGELVNNKINGVWEYYHHNGMLESKHTFKDGKFIGDSFIYYENGELIKHINHD